MTIRRRRHTKYGNNWFCTTIAEAALTAAPAAPYSGMKAIFKLSATSADPI